jgi:hypothetical protein
MWLGYLSQTSSTKYQHRNNDTKGQPGISCFDFSFHSFHFFALSDFNYYQRFYSGADMTPVISRQSIFNETAIATQLSRLRHVGDSATIGRGLPASLGGVILLPLEAYTLSGANILP